MNCTLQTGLNHNSPSATYMLLKLYALCNLLFEMQEEDRKLIKSVNDIVYDLMGHKGVYIRINAVNNDILSMKRLI